MTISYQISGSLSCHFASMKESLIYGARVESIVKWQKFGFASLKT